MKFGKTLNDKTIKEWRFYAVDYKALKKALNRALAAAEGADKIDSCEFFQILKNSEAKLAKFNAEKENWASNYFTTLENRVDDLRESASDSTSTLPSEESPFNMSSDASLSSSDDQDQDDEELTSSSPKGIADLTESLDKLSRRSPNQNCEWLKDEYRRMGQSKHFNDFIYSKKALMTFKRELNLLTDFMQLNKIAFSKILKKFDKRTGSSIQEERLARIVTECRFLEGNFFRRLQEKVVTLIDEVNSLKPELPEGWENRKVYTIGCFDLFHRGHQNVLLSLREFGYFIVAGIHDDESYFKLKNKRTIDNLETRMKNVKPFVDQLYVIPSTDPLPYIKSMVSEQDIKAGSCCYARGDDMLQFPGREWVESVMPVHFVPRTEACSSTLIRAIYHAKDEGMRAKAAFAKTRYDGKPIDEEGNVLKLAS